MRCDRKQRHHKRGSANLLGTHGWLERSIPAYANGDQPKRHSRNLSDRVICTNVPPAFCAKAAAGVIDATARPKPNDLNAFRIDIRGSAVCMKLSISC